MVIYTTVRAFAPANISCFFKQYEHKNPRWAGSYGVGFTLDKGVTVKVKKSRATTIFFNKKLMRFPTVSDVLRALTNEHVHIEISSVLPLGCGFGLSGASALATAYAVNKLLKLRKSNKELAIIAHAAEVENKTGLGDVVNQYYGGFFLKTKPSSRFLVKKLPLRNIPVYCSYFSKISTRDILINKSQKVRINKAAGEALQNVEKVKTFAEIIAIAKKFAIDSRLLKHKKTIATIEAIEKQGGHASMIMLGNAVYSDIPFGGSLKLRISSKGAHLI